MGRARDAARAAHPAGGARALHGAGGGARAAGRERPGHARGLGLTAAGARGRTRLDWIDAAKGVAILWIAYFHYFKAYADERFGAPFRPGWLGGFVDACTAQADAGVLGCGAKAGFVAFSLLGFHAVSVFLVLSGIGLALSAAGKATHDWGAWYRARLLRLYPMYWAAHAVVLVSPFVFQPEPIDGRLVWSLLGLRLFPIDASFFYLNAAWWYVTLLVQLYLVFPLLWRAFAGLGPGAFLALCAALTLGTRWLLLGVLQADGLWAQGGFFASRLFEFAFGMVVGAGLRRDAAATSRRLFGPAALLAGTAIYGVGLASYASLATYTATDALIGVGLFLLLANAARAAATLPGVGPLVQQVGAYSYGLYLVHQPYAITAAIAARGLGLLGAVAFFVPILALLAAGAMALERGVNRLTNRLLPAG